MQIPDGKILTCGRCGERYEERPDGPPRCRECGTYGEPAMVVPDRDPGEPACDPEEHERGECFHF